MKSTLNDLKKYLGMYLNLGKAADGTRILSEYGVREMCKPRQAYGAFGNYGYGVSMKQLDDLKVIEHGGALCACGRKGCFEAYASATGLIRMAKEAMAQHPESLLHATAAEVGDVNGQTIFRAKEQGDPTAVAVVERYIHYLSVGIANVINCFYPEVVALSGGIANQGEALLAPLREAVAPQVYGNQYLQTHTRILGCTLGYHAGIIGAAMLPKFR